MDEDVAVENATQKMEKRIKPKFKKGKKNKESIVGIEEAQSVGTIKSIKDVQISEKEDGMKTHHKKDKEKKKDKGIKYVSNMDSGAYGKDGSGDAADNVEMKKKKRENRNKDDTFEVGNTEEIERYASKKWPQGKPFLGMKTCKEANKVSKNQKATRNQQDGDIEMGAKDGRDVKMHSENCQVNVAEMVERKKRKREKQKSDGGDCIGWQGISSDAMQDSMTGDDTQANRTVDHENNKKKMCGASSEGHKEGSSKKDDRKKKKKKVRGESDQGDLSSLHQENLPENFEGKIQSIKYGRNEIERKQKYKKKKNYKDNSSRALQDYLDSDSNSLVHCDEIQSNEVEYANRGKENKIRLVENGSDEIRDNEVQHEEKGKKKRTKLAENGSDEIRDNNVSGNKEKKKNKLAKDDTDGIQDNGVASADKGKKKKTKIVENGLNDLTLDKSNKKVRFSGQDEVFPAPGDWNTEKGNDDEGNIVRGKRFTSEEDEIIKEAVSKYILEHDLGEEGLDMILNCKNYPKLKGCWKEIGSAIPYRPYSATYYRAQVLFRRSESRKWTQEEYDEILKYQQEHGNQWRPLADELGKHRWHVKDTWRRIKLANLKKGNWSQNEYQKLFDLVNIDLQLKVSEEKKSKHGMLRDNICWTSISDKLSTRSQATCCIKWYKQLTSPMVAEGLWADVDDYRLLAVLYSLDATCMEDVDWDNILDNRSGDVCRKRWNQMVMHIGQHGNKSFAEQVEVLAQRYCPHLIEARGAWDGKPRVP